MTNPKTKIDSQRPNGVVPGLENTNTLRTEIHLVGHWSERRWQEGVGVVRCDSHVQRLLNGLPSYSSEIAPRRRSDH